MKLRQRKEERCLYCGEFPDSEGPFRMYLWKTAPARDIDLTSYFISGPYFMCVTRNWKGTHSEHYRTSIDERRQRDSDDLHDQDVANKLGYGHSALLIVFLPDVDVNPESILWIRFLNDTSSWEPRTAAQFAMKLKGQ